MTAPAEPRGTAAVIARIDRGAVVSAVIAAYTASLTSYAALADDVLRGPIRESVRVSVDILFALLAGDEAAIVARRDEGREALMRRFALGVQPGDAVAGMRLGGEIVWAAAVAAAKPAELPALVRAAARLPRYLEVVGESAAAHAQELDAALPHLERAAHDLLQALVRGAELGEEHHRLARVLGLSLGERCRGLVIAGAADPEQLAARLRRGGVLAVADGEDVVGAAPGDLPRRVLPDDAAVALGEPVPAEGLASALQELRGLARVAQKTGRVGVVLTGELVPERLLASRPGVVRALADRVLAPLVAAGARTELVSTLTTFVACDFDRRRTAQELHLHPGSLPYRLDRITALTGLRFDRVEDLTILTLAAKAHGLSSADGKPGVQLPAADEEPTGRL